MKTYILLSILLLSSIAAQSQFLSGKHTISLGYGYATLDQARNGFFRLTKEFRYPEDINQPAAPSEALFGHPVSDLELGSRQRSGVIVFGYRYRVLSWLSAGLAVGHEQQKREINFIDRSNNNRRILVGSHKRNVYTVAAELRPVYKQFPLVSLYGLLGAGNAFITETLSNNITSRSATAGHSETAVQLTPIAISIGKKLKGYVETGYGYKGILHAGTSYSF